jgi:hypothetical protein
MLHFDPRRDGAIPLHNAVEKVLFPCNEGIPFVVMAD